MKKAFLQLHTAVFLAGFTAILGKLIGLNEGLLVAYRLLFTLLILGLIIYLGKSFEQVRGNDRWRIAGVGLIIVIHWVSFYGSGKYANASVSLVCLSACGFFTAICEPIILKKKLVWFELLLGILAIIGIYIIFDFHPQYTKGIIFGLISALGAALFPIFNKQLLQRYQPRTLTLYELGSGLLLLLLFLPLYLGTFEAKYFVPTWEDLGWLLVLASFCTVLSFDLQLKALKKISAFTANLTYNLEPVYGVVLAFLFLGEGQDFRSQFYIGLGLILLTIIIQMARVITGRKQVTGKQS